MSFFPKNIGNMLLHKSLMQFELNNSYLFKKNSNVDNFNTRNENQLKQKMQSTIHYTKLWLLKW